MSGKLSDMRKMFTKIELIANRLSLDLVDTDADELDFFLDLYNVKIVRRVDDVIKPYGSMFVLIRSANAMKI